MDDDYVLISKSELKKLKNENSKLKDEISEKKKNSKFENENELSANIIKIIEKKLNFENNFVKENLEEIKELNKNSINLMISKNDDLNLKINTLIDTIKELVIQISQMTTEKVENDENKNLNIDELVEKINFNLSSNKDLENKNNIECKLEKIEEFMNNLKILLSQIKKIE